MNVSQQLFIIIQVFNTKGEYDLNWLSKFVNQHKKSIIVTFVAISMVGVKTLSDNYGKFHGGLKDYTNGTGSLAKGASKFTDGMNEFTDGVSQIPSKMQDSIDEMTEQYSSSDFDAVSFTDSHNKNINSVQFVISTDAVELPETKSVSVEEEDPNFWERLLALFGMR